MNILTTLIVLLVVCQKTITSGSEQIENITQSWGAVKENLTDYLNGIDVKIQELVNQSLIDFIEKFNETITKNLPPCMINRMIINSLLDDLRTIGSTRNGQNDCYKDVVHSQTVARRQLEWGKRMIEPIIATKNVCPKNARNCNSTFQYNKIELTIGYMSWKSSKLRTVEIQLQRLPKVRKMQTCYKNAQSRIIENIQKLTFPSGICDSQDVNSSIQTIPKRWLTFEEYRDQNLFDLEKQLYELQRRFSYPGLKQTKSLMKSIAYFQSESSKIQNCTENVKLCDLGYFILSSTGQNPARESSHELMTKLTESMNETEQVKLLSDSWQIVISRIKEILNEFEVVFNPKYNNTEDRLSEIIKDKNITVCFPGYSKQMIDRLANFIVERKIELCWSKYKKSELKRLGTTFSKLHNYIGQIPVPKCPKVDQTGYGDDEEYQNEEEEKADQDDVEDEDDEEYQEDEDGEITKICAKNASEIFDSVTTFFDDIKQLNAIIFANKEEKAIQQCYTEQESRIFDWVILIHQVNLTTCSTNLSNFTHFLKEICKVSELNYAMMVPRVNKEMQELKDDLNNRIVEMENTCSKSGKTAKKRHAAIKCDDGLSEMKNLEAKVQSLNFCYGDQFCEQAKKILADNKH